MADDLEETIRQAAAEPLKAAGEEGSMESRSLSELIAADAYLASKAAANSPRRGFILTKLSPPGTA